MPSCYAFCSDAAHGQNGWIGPVRTGDDASKQAEQDAQHHNEENPTHEASVSCGEDQ
jgi:hypothetical protein